MSKFPTTFAMFCLGIMAGYLMGWYIHDGDRPEAYGIAILVGILFAIGSSWPIKYWIAWLGAEDERLKGQHEEEMRILQKQERELRLEKLRNETTTPKKKKTPDSFSDEDFDETSKAILLKQVRNARKSGTKVTGQGLIGGILKSIH